MSILVFDADGLIKVVQARIVGFIDHTCIISQQVYNETVIDGKKYFHNDAFEIENLILQKKIKIKNLEITEQIQSLGIGETSTYYLFKKNKQGTIISDDRRFLHFLEQKNIPFIIPTELIVALVKKKKLPLLEAHNALERIKQKVRKENYERAVLALGGKK